MPLGQVTSSLSTRGPPGSSTISRPVRGSSPASGRYRRTPASRFPCGVVPRSLYPQTSSARQQLPLRAGGAEVDHVATADHPATTLVGNRPADPPPLGQQLPGLAVGWALPQTTRDHVAEDELPAGAEAGCLSSPCGARSTGSTTCTSPNSTPGNANGTAVPASERAAGALGQP